MAKRSAAILNALADMSGSTEPRSSGLAIPLDWFQWLPVNATQAFDTTFLAPEDTFRAFMGDPKTRAGVPIDRRFAERLAAVDQIRPTSHSLRIGWLFLAGQADGKRVFFPLVLMPVRVYRFAMENRLDPVGDAEITPMVGDAQRRHELESYMEFGRGALDGITNPVVPQGLLRRLTNLRSYAMAVAEAAGFHATDVVPADAAPDAFMRRDQLVVVAGFGVFAEHDTTGASKAASLNDWAGTVEKNDMWTAFHSVYLEQPEAPPAEATDRVESPFLLTPAQSNAVLRSRTDPITVVSGAPGTGKSHTVVAIACDALSRGGRVLIAAKTDAAVDALIDLLERAPTPDPVVFGSNERKDALAARLSSGQRGVIPEFKVDEDRDRAREALRRRDRLRTGIERQLEAELLYQQESPEVAEAKAAYPALFESASGAVESALEAKGWLARRRRRKLLRKHGLVDEDEARRVVALARTAQLAFELPRRGGLEIGQSWDDLSAAEDTARQAVALWLEADSRSSRRINNATLPTVAAVATALRSGRAARREQLRRLADDRLTLALPLWIGTLPDIDDLLPVVPGLFDLVVLDEASSIDQPLAAPALLRGRRAVVVGDPHQLRHVSFLSDDKIDDALRAHGLRDDAVLSSRLDVRRNSALDVAAGTAPVVHLDEHFRSNPHLVDFVARRLYKGHVHVATRSPRTHGVDCVDVVRVDGCRNKADIVEAEVERVVAEVRRLHQRGSRSVGVVTPFRAQADALEHALLAEFTADELERLDLRVGTVHAQQGNERDVMVASVGIGPEDRSSWRFIEDPHLFAVFATRARDHLTIVLSADPPEGGLFAEYLAQCDSPPGPPKPTCPVDEWSESVAIDLRTAGARIATAYPTGRHVVDVCTDDGVNAVSIECSIHPDGPAAHIDRHLSLQRLGWEVFDAYRSRWGGRRGELAVELARRLNVTPPEG